MKKRSLAIVVGLALAIAGTLLVRYRSERQGKESFRIAFNTWIGYGPLYVAQEKGYFQEEGVKVELERIEGTGERRAALIARRLEGLGSTVDDLAVGASQGVKAKLVFCVDQSAGADGIVATQDIRTIRDLRGKSVAVQPGFVNHFFLLYLLDKEGMKPSDIQIQPMEPDAAGAAFVAGRIDAAVTWEPWLSKATERKDGHILVSSDQVEEPLIVDVFIVRDDILKSRRGEVRAIARAWFRAVEFVKKHPEEAYQVIARNYGGISPGEVADMFKGVRLLDRRQNERYFGNEHAPGEIIRIAKKAVELYAAQGLIDSRPNMENLFEPVLD